MSYPVKVYIYDLSNGLAKSMSLSLTGIYIEGIWHTSVVVYDQEIYFGQGIYMVKPGTTHHGQPLKIEDLGTTDIPPEVFFEYLEELKGKYTAENYHLLDFNCNTFSNEVVGFLNGSEIPSYIKNLPADFLATPFGQMIRPQIDSFFGAGRSQTAPLNAFGTLDPATILNGLTAQAHSSNASSSVNIARTKIEVTKPSSLGELQTLTKESDMAVVIVELPDAKKVSSTERVIKGLVEAYADSKKTKEQFPSFQVPKVALVTSERTIPKNHVEDQQTVIVQFFSKGVEVNRTNNFNPSVLQGCLEFTIMKTFSESSLICWDNSIATLNKTPKTLDSSSSREDFINLIPSISKPFALLELSMVWDNIQKENFEITSDDATLLALEIITCVSLIEKETNPDTSALVLKGISYLLRHPRISYALAQAKNSLSLYSSILNIFNNRTDSSVRESVLSLLINLYSSYSSSQLSSSVLYPLSESTPSPLNQIIQVVMVSLTEDKLKLKAIALAFNIILHLSQSSLLSEESTRIIIENLPKEITKKVIHNFFELEDGEILAMEFFSTLVQSLSNSDDSEFITQLMETLVLAQTRLILTSSRTIIPALAQSLDFEKILSQKFQTCGLSDKTIKFLEHAAKFITKSP